MKAPTHLNIFCGTLKLDLLVVQGKQSSVDAAGHLSSAVTVGTAFPTVDAELVMILLGLFVTKLCGFNIAPGGGKPFCMRAAKPNAVVKWSSLLNKLLASEPT